MEKETLEEAAEEFYSEQSKAYEDEIEPMFDISRYLVSGFIEGAKWQQKRNYSEEDMKEAFDAGESFDSLPFSSMTTSNRLNKKEFIEQFKKK